MISRAENLNLLNGVKIAKYASSISHLLYINDIFLFPRSNLSEATIYNKCCTTTIYGMANPLNSKNSISF